MSNTLETEFKNLTQTLEISRNFGSTREKEGEENLCGRSGAREKLRDRRRSQIPAATAS